MFSFAGRVTVIEASNSMALGGKDKRIRGMGSMIDRRIGPLLHCSIAESGKRKIACTTFGRATSRATVATLP